MKLRNLAWGMATVLVLAACGSSHSDSTTPTTAAGDDDGGAATPDLPFYPAPTLLLNEIGPLPEDGQHPFIEVTNVGTSATTLDGVSLVNEAGVTVDLPALAMAPNAIALITFDGTSQVSGMTVHLSTASFVSPAGSVTLQPKGHPEVAFDQVAWGAETPGGVPLGWGGVPTPELTGTTIARAPGASNDLPWIAYDATDASPGAANGTSAVQILVPENGTTIDTASTMMFYRAPGVAHYHVQIATDAGFAHVVFDMMTDTSTFQSPSLADGDYFWHVQSVPDAGAPAKYSPANEFHVHAGVTMTSGSVSVPLMQQHKDSKMLHLESMMKDGQHAWNVDHGALDTSDPADEYNCFLASVQMVNAALHGKVTQDRVGYEGHHVEGAPGPEGDLNYGVGASISEQTREVGWALGGGGLKTAPGGRTTKSGAANPVDPSQFFSDVKASIDRQVPVIVETWGHEVVAVSYRDDATGQTIYVNDPVGIANRPIQIPATGQFQRLILSYWIFPKGAKVASDEPTVALDSDGDGICDFDESNRFQTDPNKKDTDGDLRTDFIDVKQSVFDPQNGYAKRRGAFVYTREKMGGNTMELDPDFDQGGCIDGIEDTNVDGEMNGKETDNFKKNDDKCITGTLHAITMVNQGSMSTENFDVLTRFSALASKDGKMVGKAISTQNESIVSTGMSPSTETIIGKWTTDVSIEIDKDTRATTFKRTGALGQCAFTETSSGMTTSQTINCGDLSHPQITLDPTYKFKFRFDIPLPPGSTGQDYAVWDFDASKADPN